MANPVPTLISNGEWVKVAEDVTSGLIKRMSSAPDSYLQTFRVISIEPYVEPTNKEEGVLMFEKSGTEEISSSDSINVYVWANGKDGKIRVDV